MVKRERAGLAWLLVGLLAAGGGVTSWGAGGAASSATKPGGKYSTTQPRPTQAVSRVRAKLDAMELEVADLLGAQGTAGAKDPRILAARISYRMVIRHLYEVAAGTKDPTFKALVMLRADTLAAGLPAFDGLVAHVLDWQAVTSNPSAGAEDKAAATKGILALTDFEKATAKANEGIESGEDLGKYLGAMLKPLGALMALEPGPGAKTVVWPTEDAAPAVVVEELPTVEKTLARVQGANILPEVRTEMQAILTGLRENLANPQEAGAATESYRLMIDCLNLGEQIGTSTVLSAKSRSDMNQQLRLGLVLFKDPRTRDSATVRLTGVGNVASILMHLEKSQFQAKDKDTIGAAMEAAVSKLGNQNTAREGKAALGALDRFLTMFEQFTKATEQAAPPVIKDEWRKVYGYGNTILADALENLAKDPENVTLGEATRRLGVVRDNFNRMAGMLGAMKTAEVYKPKPADGVSKRMLMWARGIAEAPDTVASAATELETFQKALTLLGNTREAFPTDQADAVVDRLTADRYKQFKAKFLDTENKLINSLANTTMQSGPLIAELESEHRLLRCVQDLLLLERDDVGLKKLNQWGGWKIDEGARVQLLKQCELALAGEFVAQTGGAPPVPAPPPGTPEKEPNMLSFAQARGAITALGTAARRVNPKLTAATTTWSGVFLQVTQAPGGTAILRGALEKYADAAFLLNEGQFNYDNDVIGVAASRVAEAGRILGEVRDKE